MGIMAPDQFWNSKVVIEYLFFKNVVIYSSILKLGNHPSSESQRIFCGILVKFILEKGFSCSKISGNFWKHKI
jgi:hypothetical protein